MPFRTSCDGDEEAIDAVRDPTMSNKASSATTKRRTDLVEVAVFLVRR